LSIDEDPTWNVNLSENEKLCLVSSKKENTPKYPDLRGTIIDTEKERVIVPCYGRVQTIISPMIIRNEDGKFVFFDSEGTCNHVEHSSMKFTYGFEGPVIRVFKNNGTVYCSTSRKIDYSKSRWGSKKTFSEMFNELGGESVLEHAFDKEKKYSSHFLTFIISHPDVLLCTKQKVESGYLVFLGSKPCFTKEDCPYPESEVDWSDSSDFVTTDMFENATKSKTPYLPPSLTREQSNQHLIMGYGETMSNDIRTGSGEFVITTFFDEEGRFKILKLVSPSYEQRSKMRDEDPNLLHRFYCLSSDANLSDSEYESKYPWLVYDESKKEESEYGNIMTWKTGKRPAVSDWQNKFQNIWKHFVLSVPRHRQKEVFAYFKQFYLNREILVNWLSYWYGKETKEVEEVLSKRARKIMQLALDHERKFNPKADLTLNAKNIKRNIKFLLSNEYGSSLYMLWNDRKKYLRSLEKEGETDEASSKKECKEELCML
jgi:hypothetical protein